MAEKEVANVIQTAGPEPKKTRKPRKPRAPKAAADVELEISEEDEDDLPPDHVQHAGNTITLNGDVSLRVMTLDEQKKHGIKTIAGEMGKKCKKAPVVITFKTPKAAIAFFNACMHAETPEEEYIDDGKKVWWDSSTMTVTL